MNRRELLLSAGAGTLLLATPGALARVQKIGNYQHPGVYVEELSSPNAITGLPTGGAIFVGQFSDSLATGAVGDCYGRAIAPAGFELAQPLVEQFFDQGGNSLILMQAAAPAKGQPDYAGALAALDRPDAPEFNLLLLSGAAEWLAADPVTLGALYRSAASTARRHFAQLVIEAPDAAPDYAAWRTSLSLNDPDMAAYAPWLTAPDGRLVAPGAAICGVIARSDHQLGVWQSAAGRSGELTGWSSRAITDDQLTLMSAAQVNGIRPIEGTSTIWGARTLSSEPAWLFQHARRLLRWTEASIARSISQYVFQPNDRQLWDSIKRDITAFSADLWRQGALIGATEGQAFRIACGLGETMTEQDVLHGIVRIDIALATTWPDEFTVIYLDLELAS